MNYLNNEFSSVEEWLDYMAAYDHDSPPESDESPIKRHNGKWEKQEEVKDVLGIK